MSLTPDDWSAIRLTLALASIVTILLLAIGTPIAWWLARSRSWLRAPLAAVVALPLVLPPTVLGFYLLLLMGPNGPVGAVTNALGIGLLPFRFSGLVLASFLYSMPFVIQPLRSTFAEIGQRPLEEAACLRAGPLDSFLHVVLPMARRGLIGAAILGFAHTLGEFGVVLMIGGNIPGQTRVLSIQIYDHVEALEYAQAHWLAAGMLLFSFLVLLAVYLFDPSRGTTRDSGRFVV
jgi:molybdate transport system permease protein